MEKKNIQFPKYATEMLEILKEGNVLLVAEGKDRRPNPMTIAWGSIMFAWNKPIFVVMVRRARYTYNLLEESDDFTINFFDKSYSDVMTFCGSKSGRDYDKFKETKLTSIASKSVDTPVIKEAFLNMECKMIYKEDINPHFLEPLIIKEKYMPNTDPQKTYHKFYYGEIVEMYGDLSKKRF